MTPFEYVTVLVSIVLGLGITQLVTGTADIIHSWDRVKLYWPHVLWIVLVFFLHLQEWWVLYDLRQFQQWRLATFFFTLLYPINLFVLARILFPSASDSAGSDLRAFYLRSYRKFFVITACLPVISFIDNVFINNLPLRQQYIHFVLLGVMGVGAVKGIQNEWWHKLIAAGFALTVLVSIIVNWNDWTITI